MTDNKFPVENPILVFPLSKPITVMGVEVTELGFREPTVPDIRKVGNPVKTVPNEDGIKFLTDHDAYAPMLSRLSNVTVADLDKLDIGDYEGIWWQIAPFFTPRFPFIRQD